MTVWSWLRLTACLWLVRKAVKATGWLLAFVTVIAARPPLRTTWPLTPADRTPRAGSARSRR